MTTLEKIKKHWAYGVIIILVGLIGGTWKVANEVLVKPKEELLKIKDEKIQGLQTERDMLKQQIEKGVGKPTSIDYAVFQGQSVVIQDGKILLNVLKIEPSLKYASIKLVNINDQKTQEVTITPDAPGIINYENSKVMISLLRIRGDIIDFTVSKQ